MSDAQHRTNLLAAHSVALHVLMVAPVPPTSVMVTCHTFSPDKPSVDVNFHKDPDGVQRLAGALGVEATTQPHSATNPQPYTVATAEIAGIPVKIWTLMDAPEVAA